MAAPTPTPRECGAEEIERERRAALGRLAIALRYERQVTERLKATGLRTMTADQIEQAIELREWAEALCGEWR